MPLFLDWQLLAMNFGHRLAALRKERSLTQQSLAGKVGCHVTMIRRYEANETQPTLEVIRKIALALSVSADALVFDAAERGPHKDDLKLQFEAVSKLPKKEQDTVKTVIDSILLMSDAKRYTSKVPA